MKHINENENDFHMVLSNVRLHEICVFVRNQQRSYVAHVIRMSVHRNVKKLTFNNDTYTRRGRPVKSLVDQVVENENVDRFCNLVLQRKR